MLQDGTAKFAVLDLRGSGLNVDTYSTLLQLVKSNCRETMFDSVKSVAIDNMGENFWRNILKRSKTQLLMEIETELQEAIKVEFE